MKITKKIKRPKVNFTSLILYLALAGLSVQLIKLDNNVKLEDEFVTIQKRAVSVQGFIRIFYADRDTLEFSVPN